MGGNSRYFTRALRTDGWIDRTDGRYYGLIYGRWMEEQMGAINTSEENIKYDIYSSTDHKVNELTQPFETLTILD